MAKRSKFWCARPLATLLLCLWTAVAHMACLIPQDDEIVTELPQPANLPLRILQDLAEPEQRVASVNLGPGCPRIPFQVQVDDPNSTDEIRAYWYIDPNERYVAEPGKPEIRGNPGVPTGAGATVRLVQAPSNFFPQLAAFRGNHRVEVVVTDGEFREGERIDPNGDPKPYLEVFRPSVRVGGQMIPVPAYRDEYVWFVDVDNSPCNP